MEIMPQPTQDDATPVAYLAANLTLAPWPSRYVIERKLCRAAYANIVVPVLQIKCLSAAVTVPPSPVKVRPLAGIKLLIAFSDIFDILLPVTMSPDDERETFEPTIVAKR